MKAAFYTLGCKVNQNETSALEQLFAAAGYTIVPPTETADVYVVNSCTVTAGGDARSRQWLRRARRENPAAVTVLTGCFPQAFPQNACIPEADVITGTAARGRLLEYVNAFLATGRQVVEIAPHTKEEVFEELPIEKMPGRTRAFVKVEDGCNRRCAYCIIPKARGPVRSRAQDNILQELQTLAKSGYKEVVFTGINLPSYGRDTGTDLADLLEKAAQVEGLERLRFSSLDPDLITDEQIARFSRVEKFCPQFHLSLQSGCDATLRRMRRPYTAAQYAAAAQKLRAAMPGASLTTDVIVGFPGETEEEFAQSLAFVAEMQFLKVHVFPFSPRPGTPAAEFEGQISTPVKNARVHLLQARADAVRAEWIAGKTGTVHQVLLEKAQQGGLFTGYTKNYIPVLVNAPGAASGSIITCRLGKFNGEHCQAHPEL